MRLPQEGQGGFPWQKYPWTLGQFMAMSGGFLQAVRAAPIKALRVRAGDVWNGAGRPVADASASLLDSISRRAWWANR